MFLKMKWTIMKKEFVNILRVFMCISNVKLFLVILEKHPLILLCFFSFFFLNFLHQEFCFDSFFYMYILFSLSTLWLSLSFIRYFFLCYFCYFLVVHSLAGHTFVVIPKQIKGYPHKLPNLKKC